MMCIIKAVLLEEGVKFMHTELLHLWADIGLKISDGTVVKRKYFSQWNSSVECNACQTFSYLIWSAVEWYIEA